METLQVSVKEAYEKLHLLITKHPGPIDQYSDLKKMLRKCGFKSQIVFRGKDYEATKSSDRYEIITTDPGSTGWSKRGKGRSLGEAVKETVESCNRMHYIHQQQ